MANELSEKEMQELERLYGHNREENNLQQKALKDDKAKFYRWGALYFQIMTVLMIIAMVFWGINLLFGLLK